MKKVGSLFKATACLFLFLVLVALWIFHEKREFELALFGVEGIGVVIYSSDRRCGKRGRRTCYDVRLQSESGFFQPHAESSLEVGSVVYFVFNPNNHAVASLGQKKEIADVMYEAIFSYYIVLLLIGLYWGYSALGWFQDALVK